MRELTFRGFLTKYVQELSEGGDRALSALVLESEVANPRLREPLFLYAMFSDKCDTLLKVSKDHEQRSVYEKYTLRYTKESMMLALEQNDPSLPYEYRKVWNSYQSAKNRYLYDKETKELMRQRVLRLQQTYNVSNYRIYTDLHLNPGNVNAWLKHGYCEKVGLDTAREILHFVENFAK